jgi:hypothetical protein
MRVDAVESTLVSAVAYDADARILLVALRSGEVYEYAEVTPEAHAALLGAESVGRHFNTEVRRRYQGRRLAVRYLRQG